MQIICQLTELLLDIDIAKITNSNIVDSLCYNTASQLTNGVTKKGSFTSSGR